MTPRNNLTLCVIAGNVEHLIDRFLDQFGALTDNIIVVGASGEVDDDATIEIAKRRGCGVGIYLNHKPWPHVDDFAAARNAACDMAETDWLMWADTDDTITTESIRQIHRLLADIEERGHDVDAIQMRYVVPEDGIVNWRERIWRRGSARWVFPVHECLKFDDDAKHMRFEGAEIVHASGPRNPESDERNLRILESIQKDDRTISQHFHVFQALIALGRDAEAIPKAIEFVQLPNVGKPEVYEAFFQLARMAGNPAEKKAMLLQAAATDPTRREALGELGLASIPHDPIAADGWTTAMMAARMPADPPWNLRRIYYGHVGAHLRGMALRMNNRREEADTLETNHFVRSGAKISLLHATRGRAQQAIQCRRKWFDAADNPDSVEHIFGLDADDEQAPFLTVHRAAVTDGSGGPVTAWNLCAAQSSGAVLVQLSDDWRPVKGWDTAILGAIGDTSKPAALAVGDGNRKDDLLCMAILTRARYREQGYLFHPDFFSMYSDNWFSHCAFRDGVVIDARDRITFEHRHPAFGKARTDLTYDRSNATANYQAGKRHLERLLSGAKTCRDFDGWCDYGAFYKTIAQSIPDGGTFVEIGSWLGQSIIHFAQRRQDTGKPIRIACVDTFKGESNQPAHVEMVKRHGGSIEAEFRANIEAACVSDMIEVIVGDSAQSAAGFDDGSLDGVFIDAAHDYESVKKDLAAWFPKMKHGGIFSGHDWNWHEVSRAVTEHANENGYEVASIGNAWFKTTEKQ